MKKFINFHGIKILYAKNKTNKATYCEFGINYGAFEEKILGTAHYLEHMLFTETEKRTHEEIEKESFLNRINAHTNFDSIRITFDQSSRLIEHCFEVCSDIFFHSKITKDYVEKERGIIKAEISKKTVNPHNEIYFKHCAKLYENKKFLYSAAGSLNSVEKITPKVLTDFKNKYFFRENFSVIIVTNKSLCSVKKLIKTYILPNLASKHEKIEESDNTPFCKKTFVQIINKDIQNSIIALNFAKMDRPKQPLQLLKHVQIWQYITTLLVSKHLKQRLREEKSFVYSISHYGFKNNMEKLFGISFETDNKNILPSLKEVKKVLDEVYEKGFSKEEFDDFVKKAKLSDDMEYDVPGNNVSNLLHNYKNYGKFFPNRLIEKSYYSITLDEINKYYKENFKVKNIYLSIMTNNNTLNKNELKKIFIEKE